MDKTKKKKKSTVTKLPPQQQIADINVPLKDYVEEVKPTINKPARIKKEQFKLDIKYYLERLEGESNEDYEKRVPHTANDGDIGMDIVATSVEYDMVYDRYIYHTGFYTESERGVACKIMPRSSNSKTDAYLCNGVGLVDVFTYRGEYCVMFKNRDSLDSLATIEALRAWIRMPWYQRLFTNYDKFEQEIILTCRENALEFAPYGVGAHIGQLVWEKVPEVNMVRVNDRSEFTPTTRGEGGFGSTGK